MSEAASRLSLLAGSRRRLSPFFGGDRPRAELFKRNAEIFTLNAGRSGAALRDRFDAWRRLAPDRRSGSFERALTEGQPSDAVPAEMCVDALDDHGRAMLDFERHRAFDTQHQGGRFGRRARIALWRARRPLQLDRPAAGREARSHDLGPVGDQARFAESVLGQNGFDERPDEIAEGRGPGASFSASAFRHRLRPSMVPQCPIP